MADTTRTRMQHLFGGQWDNDAAFQEKLAEFLARTDHNVTTFDPMIPDEDRWLIPNMNCFSYAFGFHKFPAYHRWIKKRRELDLLNGEFIADLIERGRLKEITGVEPPAGSLVMYYHGDKITHCGVISSDKRVRSKFNVHEFYEHGLLEVQTSYGTPTRYFEPLEDEMRKRIIDALEDC